MSESCGSRDGLALFIDAEDIRAMQPWQTKICPPQLSNAFSRTFADRAGKQKGMSEELKKKTRKDNSNFMLMVLHVAFFLVNQVSILLPRISDFSRSSYSTAHAKENVTDPLFD